ncbi:MAG: hypothetical protein KTR16_06540 [Acidiferrobacterales bacterium]|nr:hypothetical protein [Acidiferrobacterales bacterium]
MKNLVQIFIFLLLIQALAINAQENKPTNFSVPIAQFNSLEYEKRNISMTAEDGGVVYKSQQDIDREIEDMLRLYSAKNYADAYPIVSELSQWGIKDAQAILGGMYLKGEHVDQSTERGLLWLGVAKEESSQRAAAESFDYVYGHLGAEHKTYIDQKVAAHVSKFGLKAQNINCERESRVGSNLTTTICYKRSRSDSLLHAIP